LSIKATVSLLVFIPGEFMANEKNPEYGIIASLLLQAGLVGEKQLQYADRIRRKLATPTPLLNILKERGDVNLTNWRTMYSLPAFCMTSANCLS